MFFEKIVQFSSAAPNVGCITFAEDDHVYHAGLRIYFEIADTAISVHSRRGSFIYQVIPSGLHGV